MVSRANERQTLPLKSIRYYFAPFFCEEIPKIALNVTNVSDNTRTLITLRLPDVYPLHAYVHDSY